MANIKYLADKASLLFRTGQATSYPSAAQLAVKQSGITYKPDIKRLAKQVLSELGKRGNRAKKRRIKRSWRGPDQLTLDLHGGKMN